MGFIPHTDQDRQEMLAKIGVERVSDLFHDIPPAKSYVDFDLPEPLSEMEASWELGGLATVNINADEYACFLGYEIHALHANDKHNHRGQRCINGSIGLRVPKRVIHDLCLKYMRRGKPYHLMQRTNDSVYSIMAQYQTEYRGVVQYYRLAYNLHQLGRLKWVIQQSLVCTLSKKLKISKAQVYSRYKTTHQNEHGTYKVLEAKLNREAGKTPLTARFGGIPLRYNKCASINDAPTTPIWSGRSELVERLLAQECELCGATNNIEVHHIRKLADLERHGQTNLPQWVRQMATRRRKTLVVCRSCHHDIQYGRYDGPKLST